MENQDESEKFETIGVVFSGPAIVFSSLVILLSLRLLEEWFRSWAVISEDAESITYDLLCLVLWKVFRFLNGRVMGSIISLAFVSVLGGLYFRGLETKRWRAYFGISFVISCVLYIIIRFVVF